MRLGFFATRQNNAAAGRLVAPCVEQKNTRAFNTQCHGNKPGDPLPQPRRMLKHLLRRRSSRLLKPRRALPLPRRTRVRRKHVRLARRRRGRCA